MLYSSSLSSNHFSSMKGPYVSRLLLVQLVLGFTFWKTNDQLPSSHLYLSKIAKDVKLISFFFFFLSSGFQWLRQNILILPAQRLRIFTIFVKLFQFTSNILVSFRIWEMRLSNFCTEINTNSLIDSVEPKRRNSVEYPSLTRRRVYRSVL